MHVLIVFFSTVNMVNDKTIEMITARKLGITAINTEHPITIKTENVAIFEKKAISLSLSAVFICSAIFSS